MRAKIGFIEPSVVLLNKTLDPIRLVEYAYRTCYQSRDKVGDNSYMFIKNLLYPTNSDVPHTSPLEHVKVEMTVHTNNPVLALHMWQHAERKYYIDVLREVGGSARIRGSLRALFDLWSTYEAEPTRIGALQYATNRAVCEHFPIFEPLRPLYGHPVEASVVLPSQDAVTDFKICTDTASFNIVTTRDVLQELARHRHCSFSVESTRYCNYAKRGFVFVKPYPYSWAGDPGDPRHAQWVATCKQSCKGYLNMQALGAKAEEARMLLPGGLKTELVMTADTRYWVEHFLPLRDADAAHPQIRLIAKEIRKYVE